MAKYSEIGTSVETLLDDLFKITDKLNVKEGETFIIDFNKKHAYHSTRNCQNTFEIPWKAELPLKSTTRNRKLIWTFFQLVEIDDKNSTKWSIKLIKNWFDNQETKNNFWLKLLESEYDNSTKKHYKNSLFLVYYMDNIIHQNEREKVFDLIKENKKYLANLFKSWSFKNDKYLPIKKSKDFDEKICYFVENELIKKQIKSKVGTLRIVSSLKEKIGDWNSFPISLFDSPIDYISIEKAKDLQSLIRHKKRIEVPSFQRGYVWKDTIVAKFINDLFDLIDGKIGEIFLGTLVFSKKGENTLILIDGQQRFITLLMVVLAIGHYIGKENKKNCFPKCFVDYFKNISEKIIGNDHLLTLLSIFELKGVQDFSLNDLNSHIENIFHKIFGLVYKKENLSIIEKNIDKVWKRILEKIKIFTFVFESKEKMRKPLDIFVTMNTTSQIMNSYDLIKAFLMSKTSDNIDENLKKIDEYFSRLNNYKNVFDDLIYKRKLLEHYYYYLCIRFNRDLNEVKVEKDNVIDLSLKPYYYFVDNIFNLIKLEKNWESVNNLYYFKDIEWLIKDFFAFSKFFHVLLKLLNKTSNWTRKTINDIIPFKNFEEIIDLLIHLVKPISFYPILIFWFEQCALKEIAISELRSLMWSLVKYYLIKFQGDSSSGWGQFIRNHHNEFKGKYTNNEKFLRTIQKLLKNPNFSEGDCINQIKTMSIKKRYAKSVFFVLEWYYRGMQDLRNSKYKNIKKIFCDLDQNSQKRKELQNKLWNYENYELEHIAPNSFKKVKESTRKKLTTGQWDGLINDIKELKESLGNKTLLLEKLNRSFKNETYDKKKSYMQKQEDVLLINKNQTFPQFDINAFGMNKHPFKRFDGHIINLEECPSLQDIKERENNIVQQVLLLLEWKF